MKRKWAQYIYYLLGILILVIGVVLQTKVNLGMAPYDGLVLNVSLASGLTYGMVNILFGVVFVLVQIAILRKEFKLVSLIQMVMLVYISTLINFFMYTVFNFEFPSDLMIRIPLFALATVCIGLGIALYMAARLYSFPLETMIAVIYEKFGIKIVVTKWSSDALFLLLSLLVAKLAHLKQGSIGLGTIVLFVAVGPLINIFFDFFTKQLEKLPE